MNYRWYVARGLERGHPIRDSYRIHILSAGGQERAFIRHIKGKRFWQAEIWCPSSNPTGFSVPQPYGGSASLRDLKKLVEVMVALDREDYEDYF